MKNRLGIQRHPNQEDKTGRAAYASPTRVNYSTSDSRVGKVDAKHHKAQKPNIEPIHRRRKNKDH